MFQKLINKWFNYDVIQILQKENARLEESHEKAWRDVVVAEDRLAEAEAKIVILSRSLGFAESTQGVQLGRIKELVNQIQELKEKDSFDLEGELETIKSMIGRIPV